MKLHLQTLFVAVGLGIKRNWHIFIGLILGVLVGVFFPQELYPKAYSVLNFVAGAFINLIQMVVIPLVISAIIIGISNIGDSKQLTKFGTKMILYYGIITVIAVTLATVIAIIIKPGVNAESLIRPDISESIKEYVAGAIQYQQDNLSEIFLGLIPKNPFEVLSKGDMVPLILFVSIFAVALARCGEISRSVVAFFESIFAATMKVIDWIMYFASVGVFALTAVSVGTFGVEVFNDISKYLAAILIALGIQFFIVYPSMLKIFSKVPPTKLFAAISEAIMVAFGTASSSATLPLTITCCEKRGISNRIWK